jgi:hypothetical protein
MVQSRIDFGYKKSQDSGLYYLWVQAWVGEPGKETPLGPWHSDELPSRRRALEDIVAQLLNEIISGHVREQLIRNGGHFEPRQPTSDEQAAIDYAPHTVSDDKDDAALGKTLRQVYELMEENDRLDSQLQNALRGNAAMNERNRDLAEQLSALINEHEETKKVLREAHARIERLSGRLAQVRAITEKDI